MKVVCYDKKGCTLTVGEVDHPHPGPGEVAVRVAAVGVCGSDLTLFSSGVLPDGYVMGHEIAGVVDGVGDNVSRYAVGDRVAVRPAGCGACAVCVGGLPHLCLKKFAVGTGSRAGGFAEYVIVPETMIMRVPDDVALLAAALVDTIAVACHGIGRADFVSNETAVVFGAGPIGLSVVMMLKKMGAAKIGVVEMNEGRRRAAAGFGADIAVSPEIQGYAAELREAFSGIGPHAAFECAGRVRAVSDAIDLVRPGGRVALMGIIFDPLTISPIAVTMREVSILPVFSTRAVDNEKAMDFIRRYNGEAVRLISDVIDLESLPRIFSEIIAGSPKNKVMVEFFKG